MHCTRTEQLPRVIQLHETPQLNMQPHKVSRALMGAESPGRASQGVDFSCDVLTGNPGKPKGRSGRPGCLRKS